MKPAININKFFCIFVNAKKKKEKKKAKSGFSANKNFLLCTSDRLINRTLQEFLSNKILQNGTY